MKNGSLIQRIAIGICITIAVSLICSPAISLSIDSNYVLVDHHDVHLTVPTYIFDPVQDYPPSVTSYEKRGYEEYSVGYYFNDGNIISAHSLLADDDPATSLDLDLIIRDDISDYLDDETDYIFNSVIATGSLTELTLTGSIKAYDDSDGATASDFSARGAMITATDYAKVLVDGMKINTNGFVRAAFIADDRGQILIKDSTVTAMGANPLTEAYVGYYNSADQNIMISPPWVLGIQGGARLANMLGYNSTLTVVDSKVTSGAWGVLSTDAGNSFRMNVIDSKIEILPEKRGGMSSGKFSYSHKYGSGYGTYIIGNATEYFYGTTFKGTTYASILTGGDAYYRSSRGDIELYDAGDTTTCEYEWDVDNNVCEGGPPPGPPNYQDDDCWVPVECVGTDRPPALIETLTGAGKPTSIHSVFGFMAHNSGSINVLDGTEVQTEEATFLYKAGDVDFVVDGAKLHPKSGIILQMMDNDDSTVGTKPGPPGPPVFNTEFHEKAGWPSTWTWYPDLTPPMTNNSNFVTLSLKNGDYKGDVFNGTGGNTGYSFPLNELEIQKGDALQVYIGEKATLTGAISLTETRHIDENGDQNTYFTINEYYYLGHVENRNHRNDHSSISVVIEGGVWQVTGESLISSLIVNDGAVKGTKGKKVVMTVDEVLTEIQEGQIYEGGIVITVEKADKKCHKK